MRLLDRYILRQFILPALIGLVAFVVILVGDVARQLASAFLGGNVPGRVIAEYLLLHVPYALSWSLPVGTIVGVSMTITALANHGELTAMRVGGASLQRLFAPLVGAGLLASAFSFYCGEFLAPPASRQARALFVEIGLAQPILQEQRNVFFRDEATGRLFFVEHMNPKTNELERVTIWEADRQGRVRGILCAQWAEIRANRCYLRQGAAVRLGADGEPTGPIERFGEREIPLHTALQEYYASRYRPLEIGAPELREMIRALKPAGRDTQKLEVQYHFKYSLPLSCFIFALLAAPLAFRYARLGSFAGLVAAIVLIFLFNGVRSWTLAFGLAGALAPVLAGWIPDLLFGFIGLLLFVRAR